MRSRKRGTNGSSVKDFFPIRHTAAEELEYYVGTVNCVYAVDNGKLLIILLMQKNLMIALLHPGGRNLLDYSCCKDDNCKTVNESEEVATTGTVMVTADSANNGATVPLFSSMMGSLPAT